MDTSKQALQRELLPIGKDDYKKIIDEGCIYIDKTLAIEEFWRNKSEVILITRPRRFGKSITLSMIKYFFEKTEESTAYLFEKSKIWQAEGFKELQGTYPVIHISFKDVKADKWEEAYQKLKSVLSKEVLRSLKSIESTISKNYKKIYDSLVEKSAGETEFAESLLFITEVFKEYTNKNTIILIDEYDTPITHAYIHGFYDKMIGFMRSLLSPALKGNPHLHKALMTGVVRTAKDGILSGLNNPDIYTMLDAGYADKFGFTQEEIGELLLHVGYPDKKEEVTSWYNGYVIGSKHDLLSKVYNPWSVLQYIKSSCIPETYWANTGSTELLERLIAESGDSIQKQLKLLIEGNALQAAQIDQDVILLDLDKTNMEPWSFLFFAGYLTANKHVFQYNKHYYTLSIPNKEIAELYKKLVVSAIGKTFSSSKLETLLRAFIKADIPVVNTLLEEFILSMCSFHDLPHHDVERSLHMFVLGLLSSASGRYVVKSNLESGIGRYDIAMYPKNMADPAIIMEFKKGKDLKLEKLADQAIRQIKSSKYETSFKDFGYQGEVLCYGIAMFGKQLLAKVESVYID